LDSPVFALNVDNTGLWISWRAVSHTISKESSLIPPSLVIDPPFFLRLSHFFPQSVTVTHTHFRFAQHHFRGRCFLCGRGGHNSALSPDQAGDLSLGLAIRAARASPHIFNSAKFFLQINIWADARRKNARYRNRPLARTAPSWPSRPLCRSQVPSPLAHCSRPTRPNPLPR